MIGMGRCRARKCGAPEAAWRITMASGRIAASVFSVSTSDSPFETLEPDAVIETASAPSRLAAISKLVRVRVDASKNRLTIILPRSVSKLLEGWLWQRLKILGARQNGFDLGAVQLLDAEQSARHGCYCRLARATFSTSSTFSMPSISWNFTSMISMSVVCTMRPT